MIDFIKILYDFSKDGFDAGYYTASNEHIKFYVIHKEKKMKIAVTICFHSGEPKYHFVLTTDEEVLCEKKVEAEDDITLLIKEIHDVIKQA